MKERAPKLSPEPGIPMKKPLTEAQVLAAPAKDYMNDDQLAFFRQRLTELKAELLANVRDTSEHLRETEAASDPSDRATPVSYTHLTLPTNREV